MNWDGRRFMPMMLFTARRGLLTRSYTLLLKYAVNSKNLKQFLPRDLQEFPRRDIEKFPKINVLYKPMPEIENIQ